MRTINLLLLIGILSVGTAQAQTTSTSTPKKKVVFIIVDGISADQLKSADTPYLDSIAANGAYTDAYIGGHKGTYTETPTVSAVGYNSLLTGTWANKHNVWGNGIEEPNYHYPTIFKLYKEQYPQGKVGIFSSWLDNRTKLVGDGLQQTEPLEIDYYFDYSVADHAARAILEKAPDLSWVYLQFTDNMGHQFGDSKRFNAAINFEDRMVGSGVPTTLPLFFVLTPYPHTVFCSEFFKLFLS